ncbi:MAG: hypothetical protein J2P25_02450 [Nocardiopsaceae bacterium]|nr:hypothetical protein [Nocardiopsaceae bacterium]
MNLRRSARLPTPASTAAPPAPNSRPSCRPAVPPPPVCGAAGYDGEWDAPGAVVADGEDADCVAEAEAEADGALPDLDEPGALAGRDEDEDEADFEDAEPPPPRPDADDADDTDDADDADDTDDEEIDGCGFDDDGALEQAVTTVATQTAKVAVPAAVLAVLTAAPTRTARTFIKILRITLLAM